jgi:hypothetical protein
VEHDVLEPDAAVLPELCVLRIVPGEVLHLLEAITAVCLLDTHWHRRQCAQKCAQTRAGPAHPPANANHGTNKKRA